MNDRELLEMSAKAAGMRFIKPGDGYDGSLGLCLCDEHNRPLRDWNPLTDDNDALRLAVVLGMRVCIYPGQGNDYSIAETDQAKERKGWAKVTHGSNPGRATRIAIVHAAAEIGRAMP